MCEQGSEKVCRLSLIVNRSAAKRQKESLKEVQNSEPAKAQSALDMTDGDMWCLLCQHIDKTVPKSLSGCIAGCQNTGFH